MLKYSVWESFTVALISGTEKNWRRGGGRVSRLSVENFWSHSAEIFRRESSTVALLSGTQKVFGQEGGWRIKILRRKIFSHSAEIFRMGIF